MFGLSDGVKSHSAITQSAAAFSITPFHGKPAEFSVRRVFVREQLRLRGLSSALNHQSGKVGSRRCQTPLKGRGGGFTLGCELGSLWGGNRGLVLRWGKLYEHTSVLWSLRDINQMEEEL